MTFSALAQSGSALRIRPANFTAPEGDFSMAMGSDSIGFKGRFRDGDELLAEQNADFDVTTVFRFAGRVRGAQVNPEVVLVTSATTSTYTVTINGTDFVYSADTTGLLLGSGSAASIVAAPGALLGVTVAVDDLTGLTPNSVGNRLVLSGAASPANNGTFAIGVAKNPDFVIDATKCVINNQAGIAPDANNGSISWEERRIPDDAVGRIAKALVDLINAGSEPVFARLLENGNFQIEPTDVENPPTVSVAGNLSTAPVIWTATMEIDTVAQWTEVIEPRRTRDLADAAALIVPVAAGNHDLQFRISVSCAVAGTFEAEIPVAYIDALVFDETT